MLVTPHGGTEREILKTKTTRGNSLGQRGRREKPQSKTFSEVPEATEIGEKGNVGKGEAPNVR